MLHDGTRVGEVGIHVADQEDSLGLGAIKLDIGEWAYPLVNPPLKSPKQGDKVMTIFNVIEKKYYWIGFVDSEGFNW